MGLDMMLFVEKYVPRVKDFQTREPNKAFNDIAAATDSLHLLKNDHWVGFKIDVPIGYWRKANQIHGWIVDKCADGVDNCQTIHLDREQAETLVNLCKEVLADPSKAMELLPPKQGFFFGSTEIDEYYFNDLRLTIENFEPALKDDSVDYFTYQASW